MYSKVLKISLTYLRILPIPVPSPSERGWGEVKPKTMNMLKRIKAPTPKLFKKIRNAGLAMAAISGAVLASPVALPAILIKVAGYLAVAGGVASAVSQATTENNANN